MNANHQNVPYQCARSCTITAHMCLLVYIYDARGFCFKSFIGPQSFFVKLQGVSDIVSGGL